MILDAGLKFALFPMVKKNKHRRQFIIQLQSIGHAFAAVWMFEQHEGTIESAIDAL
jgi:hypothetical protein